MTEGTTHNSMGSQRRTVLSLTVAETFILTVYTISGQVVCQFQDTVTFLSEPRNVTVLEGESVRFECDFEGSDLTPSWNINNSVYYHTNLPPIYLFDQQDFSITIENVSLDLNGTYFECIVGQRKSAKGVLIILRAHSHGPQNAANISHPGIIQPPGDVNANLGLDLTTSLVTKSLVTTSVTEYIFKEYQTKSSLLLLVTIGVVIFIVTSCLFLSLVVSIRLCLSCKKQRRGISDTIEMNDAYGVLNNSNVVMNRNPAYEDLQLFRHK